MLTAEPCNVNLYFVMLHYGSKLFFITFYLIALVRGGRWVRDVFSLQECRSECKQAECLLCSLPSANLGCLSASGAAQYQTISPSQHSDTQTQVSTPPHLLITQSQTN